MTAEWYKLFYSTTNETLNITNKQIEIYTNFAKAKGLQWAQ